MDSSGIITPTRASGRRIRAMSHNQRVNSIRPERVKRGNPFEGDCLQRLRKPSWSPTIMSCPDRTPPQSGWTIDQISKLNPVDIEGSPSSHQENQDLSPSSEDKIQAEILTFFNTFKDSSPFGTEIRPLTDLEAHNSSGDVEWRSSGRTLDLDFSFGQSMDTSTCSDGSDLDEKKIHGGTFMSPTTCNRNFEMAPVTSPSISRFSSDLSIHFNDSPLMET